MLVIDSEKMVQISSTTNEIWPQQNNESRVMEKPSQDQQQPLKCPRCNSSNTKFCYYNNYSLSQPRHFCKGCKRYWTRGGTIRNVPVGGGCRKNKKIKKPNITTTTTNLSYNFHQPQIIDDMSPITSNHHSNPLLYGLPTNPSDLNIQVPRLFNSSVSNTENLGLGFSSGQIQDVMTTTNSNSHISSYPVFGSSLISSSKSNLASLIASSLQQQNFISNNNKFQDLSPYNGEGGNGIMLKGVKMEGESQMGLDWNISNHQINQIEQINFADPSLSWADTYVDPSKIVSSVPSLI